MVDPKEIRLKFRERVFIDTGAFIALHDEKDGYWDDAVETAKRIKGYMLKFVTTDYVLDEAYSGLLTKASYKNAMAFDENLSKDIWKIETISQERFLTAQEVFRRFNKDKEWSFTDCTSYVVMKELKIKKVFTFDNNFSEMGFEML